MLCVEPIQRSLLASDANNTRNIPAHRIVTVFCLGALAYSKWCKFGFLEREGTVRLCTEYSTPLKVCVSWDGNCEYMQRRRRRRLQLYQSIFLSTSVPIFRKLRNTVDLGFNIIKWTEYCVEYNFMVNSEQLIGTTDHMTHQTMFRMMEQFCSQV
jgi:hypothetical protein